MVDQQLYQLFHRSGGSCLILSSSVLTLSLSRHHLCCFQVNLANMLWSVTFPQSVYPLAVDWIQSWTRCLRFAEPSFHLVCPVLFDFGQSGASRVQPWRGVEVYARPCQSCDWVTPSSLRSRSLYPTLAGNLLLPPPSPCSAESTSTSCLWSGLPSPDSECLASQPWFLPAHPPTYSNPTAIKSSTAMARSWNLETSWIALGSIIQSVLGQLSL